MLQLGKLTNGEKLFIARRREGNTQAQEADARGLPLTAYKLIEGDEECDGWELKADGVGELETFEQCVLLRRRNNWTLDDLAECTELSKFYLCQIEKGKAPVDTLVEYWEDVSSATA